MTVPPVSPSPPSRWPRRVLVLAALTGVGVWWHGRGDSDGSATGPTRARRGGPTAGLPALPFRLDRSGQWRRLRGLGPIALAPPRDGLVRVTGTVIDVDSRKPVPDVEVVFANGTAESGTTSDLAGRYSIDVPAGHYRPFVRAPGLLSIGNAPFERLPARPRFDQVAASRLAVAPDLAVFHDLSADLEVVTAGTVRGRVLDRDGKPIPGAVVRARSLDGSRPQPVVGTDLAETDGDGSYRLELAGGGYAIEAFHDRYGAMEFIPTVEVNPGETDDVDVTMIAGCVITGRVVRAGGPAGDGAIERAWSDQPGSGFYPAGDFDEDGFRWTTGEAGTITLRAWPWKAPPAMARTFDCRDGARYDDVVFEVPSTPSDLGGRILTADGRPAANAFIDIAGLSDGTMNQQERADDEGNWEVFALPAGEYQVTAYVEGKGAVSTRVSSPGHGVDLTLSGTGTLTGEVHGMTDGSFVLTVDQCALPTGSLWPRARYLASVRGGRFRVEGVPACDLSMQASAGPTQRWLSAAVTAGNDTSIELDLSPPPDDPWADDAIDRSGGLHVPDVDLHDGRDLDDEGEGIEDIEEMDEPDGEW